MRVLAFGAHPDDIEILCAGTLARYARAAHEVVICVATDGAAGHMNIAPEELIGIREGEARAAANLLGAELLWLGFPDEFIFDDKHTRLSFIKAIREVRPDVILTHDPEDYHHDHRTVSRLVLTTSFMASLPNVQTDQPAHPVVPPIYYMDTLAGHSFQPTHYVDITNTLGMKKEMLACHESQLTWLRDHDDTDMLAFVEVVAKARGYQAGVAYAEGFRLEKSWSRTPLERLLP